MLVPVTHASPRHRYWGRAGACLLLCACMLIATRAAAQDAEDLVSALVKAHSLAEDALMEANPQLSTVFSQIGPSSAYSRGQRGFGHWSLGLVISASTLDVTNPDYSSDSPRNSDRLDIPIGAIYADMSIGVLRGRRVAGALNVGSLDLLLRAGVTLGDQTDITNNLELGKVKPIFGIGGRLGLLRGRHLPSVSLTSGVNKLNHRSFGVRGEEFGKPFEVSLDFEQTTAFLLFELGKDLGFVSPYLAWGRAWRKLDATFDGQIVYGDSNQADVASASWDFDLDSDSNLILGGLEFGGRSIRLALEVGSSENHTFGNLAIRFTR